MTTKTDFLRTIAIILFSFFLLTDIFSQLDQRRLQFNLRAGLTTGSPIITKNIPEGATGRPGIGPNLGLELTYRFLPKFSITAGAAYAQKSSQFTSPVSGKYDAARGIFGQRFPFPIRVKYTGNVEAGFNMTYLDIPVSINFHTKKWRFGLGYQYARLLDGTLDGSVDVKALLMKFNDQEFDQSYNIKDYDHAGLLKISHRLTKRISLMTEISVSLQRLMIEAEEGFSNPRNVFANVLVTYRLF
ncbi:MAG: outer membrane beta-barrel protein [Bacteroidota bacterium]